MSQFQAFHRVLVLVLALLVQGSLQAQRIKLLQLEQKGVPREGYFGLTNSSGDQVYTEFNGAVTTIITANGHWYLNGFDDAFGSTTISPGETVAFTGNDGSFRGIVAGLASNGSNTLFIDGRALQWNLGANGSYTTIGDVQGSSESVNFVGAGSVTTSRTSNTITITGTDASTDWDLGANGSYTTINDGEQVNFVGASGVTTSRSGNTITITGSSSLSGSGTTNYVTKWTSSTTLGNSAIQDNGSTVSIGGALDASYELFIADGSIKVGDAAGELNKIYFGDGTFVFVGEGVADDRLYLQGTTMSINIGGSLGTSGYVLTSNGTTASWQPATSYSWNLGANGSYTDITTGENVNFVGAGIAVTSRSTNTITITATEVDGSTSNELQTIAVTGTTTGITTLSNSGGSMTIAAGGINSIGVSGSTITITATEVDGSTSNEIQGLDFFNASSPVTLYADGSADGVMFVQGSGITLSMATDQLTITATDVSASNELQTIAVTGTTTGITTLSNSGGSMTIAAGGINSIGVSGSTITITATEVDGSVTNEAQTWSNSGTTSYTGTLSTAGGAGGGSFTIVAGSNVTVSHSAGTVTIASTAGATDLTFTGASSPYTLNSSTGTDVTFASGGIVSLSRSVNELTISATEVDGSVTNELQTIAVTGTTTGITTLSNSGGSMTIAAGGINSIGVSGSTITITATEVDGSVSNELQTIAVTGTTTGITTLSNSGGSMTIAAGGINSIGVSGSTITITATEVDGSTSNELQNLTFTGASSPYTLDISSGTDVTFASGGIVSLSRSTNELTISATEVDGSTSNELQTIAVTGTTTGITTLSNGGGSMTVAAGGINSIGVSGSTITITATEVDGSVSNELQTIAVTGTTTGITTLSNSGGSMTIAAGGINSIGVSGSTITVTATEVDGSTSNEVDTWDLGANASYTTISNTEQVNFVGAGIASTSRSTNTITITATEVDGSLTNEAQFLTSSGTTTFTSTLSTAGGSGGGSLTLEVGDGLSLSRSSNTGTFNNGAAYSSTSNSETYNVPTNVSVVSMAGSGCTVNLPDMNTNHGYERVIYVLNRYATGTLEITTAGTETFAPYGVGDQSYTLAAAASAILIFNPGCNCWRKVIGD